MLRNAYEAVRFAAKVKQDKIDLDAQAAVEPSCDPSRRGPSSLRGLDRRKACRSRRRSRQYDIADRHDHEGCGERHVGRPAAMRRGHVGRMARTEHHLPVFKMRFNLVGKTCKACKPAERVPVEAAR